jgi:hypothetical protein
MVVNVKETVADTVETVRRTSDVRYQVDQHPWLLFGGATLAGYLLGSWGGGRTSAAFSTNDSQPSATGTTADMSASHSKRGRVWTAVAEGVLVNLIGVSRL